MSFSRSVSQHTTELFRATPAAAPDRRLHKMSARRLFKMHEGKADKQPRLAGATKLFRPCGRQKEEETD